MNVASLSLCNELYELSDGQWNDTAWWHTQMHPKTPWGLSPAPISSQLGGNIPAYDLGYLLRKLPIGVSLYKGVRGYTFNVGNAIQHSVSVYEAIRSVSTRSNTPEDAAARVVIELFKQGILTKGDK